MNAPIRSEERDTMAGDRAGRLRSAILEALDWATSPLTAQIVAQRAREATGVAWTHGEVVGALSRLRADGRVVDRVVWTRQARSEEPR